jgi:hypothetical protein
VPRLGFVELESRGLVVGRGLLYSVRLGRARIHVIPLVLATMSCSLPRSTDEYWFRVSLANFSWFYSTFLVLVLRLQILYRSWFS